jgi:drug/metabolite transporter (DMT)-like permease
VPFEFVTMSSQVPTPWWAYLAVALAVAGGATGGTFFALLGDVSPALRASWRIQVTCVLQILGFAYEWYKETPEIKQRWVNALPIMILNGFVLAAHFSGWSYAATATSLTNALLFVSLNPLLMVVGQVIMFLASRSLRNLHLIQPSDKNMFVVKNSQQSTNFNTFDSSSELLKQKEVEIQIVIPVSESERSLVDTSKSANTSDPISSPTMQPISPRWSDGSTSDLYRAIAIVPSTSSSNPSSSGKDNSNVGEDVKFTPSSNGFESSIRDLEVEVTVSKSKSSPALPANRQRCINCNEFLHPKNWLLPTSLELIGTIIGFSAAAALILAGSSLSKDGTSLERSPSVNGDLVAVAAAMAMGLYLTIGASLRSWMRIFMYSLPVNMAAAFWTAVIAMATEGSTLSGLTNRSVFGWMAGGNWFWFAFGAAACAGMLGHGAANVAVRYVTPLFVGVALLVQPVLGSVYGYLAGVQGIPTFVTLICGPIIIFGAFVVTVGARKNGITLKSLFKKKKAMPVTQHAEKGVVEEASSP